VQVNAAAQAGASRYCRRTFRFPYETQALDRLAPYLLELRAEFDCNPVLIATSDETAILIADHYEELSASYLIAQNGGAIVATLADKMTMFGLAREHGVPTPGTMLPRNPAEALRYAETAKYPVMLKGAMGNKLFERTGKKMVVVNDAKELMQWYGELEDPREPNLMIQELIPGGDDEVYIFNGYFDSSSRCLAAFTGRKIRQYPVHVGCASLGESTWIPEVAEITISFMQKIGYKGVLDIGYRRDPRDGQYKVLDINPRVGQAFRLFVAENDMDCVRALYIDLTRQEMPPVVPREGRRWLIEDFDLTSTMDYFGERSLTVGEWLRSYRRVEEAAWFSVRDPLPFVYMIGRFGRQIGASLLRRVSRKNKLGGRKEALHGKAYQ
jgi:predicted ATP-grasp superfamily ATP-dependent carboligase